MNEIEIIKNLCLLRKLQFTDHALKSAVERNINIENDIIPALSSGEIIEEYSDDYPYKSYLILGKNNEDKCLHIVCAIGEDILWIITEYYPNETEWEDDFKTRKKV